MKRYLKVTEGSDCDLIAATIDAVKSGELTTDDDIVLNHMLRVVRRNIEEYNKRAIELDNIPRRLASGYGVDAYDHILIDEAISRAGTRINDAIKEIDHELSCLYMLQDEIQQILKDIQKGE